MTKLRKESARDKASDTEIDEYYAEACRDSLLYWANTTIVSAGGNATLTALTETLGVCIERLVPEDQVDRAEDIIFDLLKQSFESVKNKTKVSVKNSDKGVMN